MQASRMEEQILDSRNFYNPGEKWCGLPKEVGSGISQECLLGVLLEVI